MGESQNQNVVFDVLIVGAGPAGLAIGSELCKKHKVLLIEKNEAGKTFRSWFCPPFVFDDSVKPFTKGGVTRFLTDMFGLRETGQNIKWEAELFNEYPYIQEKELLPHWINIIENSNTGSRIINQCAYIDYFIEDNIVSLSTTGGLFKGKLLIDASGQDSKIVKKLGINQDGFYWWSVYGNHYDTPADLPDEIKPGDYMLWETYKDVPLDLPGASLGAGRPVLEYEIFMDNKAVIFILYLRKYKMDMDVMKGVFDRIMEQESSTKVFHTFTKKDAIFGWYPSGGLSQKLAQDRVSIVGDAGCWTTPCGWGMSFILNNYKCYSDKLSKLIDEDKLDRDCLNGITSFSMVNEMEILFNKFIMHLYIHFPSDLLDKLVLLLKDIGYIYIEKIFTLTLEFKDCVTVLERILETFEIKLIKSIVPEKVHDEIDKVVSFFSKGPLKKIAVDVIKDFDHLKEDVDKYLFHKEKSKILNGFKFDNC